jgi:transcriptional regulator with XRE-family HTH domain
MTSTSMAARIRKQRLSRGLTIGQLANGCAVSERTIIRWENGDNVPAGRYLATLASALDVSPLWLLGDPNGEPTAEAAA